MNGSLGFWGAAGEVTGSCFQLDINEARLLVDCGLFQGLESEAKNRQNFGFRPDQLEGVLVTHAHLDHCGRLPLLTKHGFRGPVYATRPTADFLPIVLYDSAKISAHREHGLEPLYTEDDVDQLLGHIKPVEYDRWYEIVPGVSARWLDAGHMLGSASIQVRCGSGGEGGCLLFSGDLGNEPSPLVRRIETPDQIDTVIMESTYGDRMHPPRGEEIRVIQSLSRRVEENSGTLLIPAFSLERTQELLHIFDHLKRSGQVSNGLQVFLDSPMALKATAVFERYPQYFNEHLKKQFQSDDPFDFPGLQLVEHSEDSRRLTNSHTAKVIISGSGMMSGGRVVNHAKKLLSDKRTIVLINGYQAVGTLGREVLERRDEVIVDGLRIPVKAHIVEVTSMSGHADQSQLLDWFGRMKQVKKVYLVHGEDEARKVLASKLSGLAQVTQPLLGKSYSLS